MMDYVELDDRIDGIEKVPFEVRDLQSADWCVRKALEAEARIRERTEYVKAKIERAKQVLAEENAKDEKTVEYMAELLEPFAWETLTGKTRTLKLANGTISLRKRPDKLDIDDEQAVIDWCKANAPECIVVKESLDKRALKARHEKDAVPGVHINMGMDRLYIKGDD